MRARIFLCVLLTSVLLGAQTPKPAEGPELPPLEKCQAENLQVKATLMQMRQQLVQRESELAQMAITKEQERLEARFRELLKPEVGAAFDWTTLTFKPASPPKQQ